jgi:hypothetical protein
VIFRSTVIPKVSLTRSLIPRVAVVRIKEQKPLDSVCIPYVKGVSEKFKRIGNPYNIRTIFKTEHTLRSSLTKTRPERDPQQRHSASTAFLVNVAEATLAKQPDF